MRKVVRIALWSVGVLIALVALAAGALYLFVDAETYRGVIESRLEAGLGRDVTLGPIDLSFLPTFGLGVDGFAVAGLPGEPSDTLVSARGLRIGAKLLPLLSRKLEVTALSRARN